MLSKFITRLQMLNRQQLIVGVAVLGLAAAAWVGFAYLAGTPLSLRAACFEILT